MVPIITAMTVALIVLILASVAVAAARIRLNQFQVSEPPDYEAYRSQHDLDAIRTRFG